MTGTSSRSRTALAPLAALAAGAAALSNVSLLALTAALWRGDLVARAFRAGCLSPRLADPFCTEAARRHRRLRAVPASNLGTDREEDARSAAMAGLATDAVYHSRIDLDALRALRSTVAADLDAARWETGTLYLLRDEVSRAVVAARHDPARDLLRAVDGLPVSAPGWHAG